MTTNELIKGSESVKDIKNIAQRHRIKRLHDFRRELHKEKINSRIDVLTGVLNRSGFKRELRKLYAQAERENKPLVAVFADINKFKQINDMYGHRIGDEALRYYAQALSRTMRDTDSVARFGGDEFVVLMPNINRAEANKVIVDRFKNDTMNSLALTLPTGDSIPITASYGIASYPEDARTDVELMTKADEFMYRKKLNV